MEEGNQANLRRWYYAAPIGLFLTTSSDEVLGVLAREGQFDLEMTQRDAWRGEIQILQTLLHPYADRGGVFFEFAVPRLGKRIDVVLIIDHVIFVLEFKVGEQTFTRSAIEQAWDYALDLKNFHETSHSSPVVPILVATNAQGGTSGNIAWSADGVARPVQSSPKTLKHCLDRVLAESTGSLVDWGQWQLGRYSPTPTIIEAAKALYKRHSVEALSRQDAGAKNLSRTSRAVSAIISNARREGIKAICFVTGVPGAGKTLVGLDVATRHMDPDSELHSVYLSGNGPLVSILQEALARDTVQQAVKRGEVLRKGVARQEVKAFIQNVHHFRDDCLQSSSAPPEHVAIFDEAQRAWNQAKTTDFMARKKGRPGFDQSESQYDFVPGPPQGLGRSRMFGRRRSGNQYWRSGHQRVDRVYLEFSPRLDDSYFATAA